MSSFQAEIVTPWATTRVFDYLVDFRNLPDWHPAVRSSQLKTLDPAMRNARYTVRARLAGRTVACEILTVDLDRPTLIEAAAQNSVATTSDRFEIVRIEGGGTRLMYATGVEMTTSLKLVGPLMVAALRRAWRKAAVSLAESLEATDRQIG